MAEIRPMRPEDVAGAELVWYEAITDVRRRQQLPLADRDAVSAPMERRLRHLLATDPEGSMVAVEGSRVVAVAQALIRDDFWVLSLLGVHPNCQSRGIGGELLQQTLRHGGPVAGTILSSRDPKAMRLYAAAG